MKRIDKKFLTVFAVLDDNAQNKLSKLQQIILNNNLVGTQTMDIPFHISLGSFPINMKDELIERIKTATARNFEFEIYLQKTQDFNNSVLFIKPKTNVHLKELQKLFNNNFADGYKFYPHITLFCGEKRQVKMAKKLVKKEFSSFNATITSLYMGEFYPTKIIFQENLQKNKILNNLGN